MKDIQCNEIIYRGKKVLVTEDRIDKFDIPPTFNILDIRHIDDDSTIPYSVEEKVIVNKFAHMISLEEILMDGEEHILDEEEVYDVQDAVFNEDDMISLEDWIEENDTMLFFYFFET